FPLITICLGVLPESTVKVPSSVRSAILTTYLPPAWIWKSMVLIWSSTSTPPIWAFSGFHLPTRAWRSALSSARADAVRTNAARTNAARSIGHLGSWENGSGQQSSGGSHLVAVDQRQRLLQVAERLAAGQQAVELAAGLDR